MTTIHMIFNAHLDPIWLWPWQASIDESLATCRSACDRLDSHPDLRFTRGESWVYEQIEQVDPALFERIKAHVKAGRWEIVGGWHVQPDCNLPSGFGFEKQIDLGKRYFLDRFGFFPTTAYNVDSFGHAATLPGYMRAAGQDSYVMMRPQEHEMALPCRLFRWRGYEDGPEVTTFRIASSYAAGRISLDHVRRSLTELPDGIEHTMCFAGLGDHGGGPTEEAIAWCRENADAVDGARIEFSTVDRFFKAIEGQHDLLPVVTGELQMHAIGCYTVHRPVKCGVRHGEHMLAQAEVAIGKDPAPPANTADLLDMAWRQVCFHQFHDTLGGTCLPSAFKQVDAELGMASAIADHAMQYSLRRQMNALPDDPLQRIVAFNASDEAFDGYVEFEPWLGGRLWESAWRLVDEDGQAVASQLMDAEAQAGKRTRLLFKLTASTGALRCLRIDTGSKVAGEASRIDAGAQRTANDTGVTLDVTDPSRMCFGSAPPLQVRRLELLDDRSDTWTHRLDRYASTPVEVASWEPPTLTDAGPLMASLVQSGRIGKSSLRAEWRVYADEPFVELRLRVSWAEQFRLLKLTIASPSMASGRVDGISGGELARACDGKERPLRDRTLLRLQDGQSLGVVCPDVFALDGDERRVRLTLLRSPLMAWHDPDPGTGARRVFADQGEHEFRFRFLEGDDVTGALLDQHALMMQRPLVMGDLTRGMPKRITRD